MQMKKRRLREVKSLAQGHTASERQNQGLNGGCAGCPGCCVPPNVFTTTASMRRRLCLSLAVYVSPALSMEPTTVRGLNYTDEGRRERGREWTLLLSHRTDPQTCAAFQSAILDLGLSPATSACDILCWPPFHSITSLKLRRTSPPPASWTRCHVECLDRQSGLFCHPLHHEGGGRRLAPKLPESRRKDETCP